jgi:2-polyprenyl-3-methyl-5-hydroxy-6-metoxy-1,4-benzoquinol methylase
MKKQTFRLLFKTLSPCLSNLRDLGNIGNLKKPQLLDIGTGTGALLEVANEFGFDATGLEPDKKFAQKAKERGLKVINSTLEKARLPTHSFDIITMFDVLEHIPDLHSALSSIVKTIKPNGLLILSTPNTSSLSFKLMDSYWPHFKKEHIYYFNPKSLKTLISPYGFITLKILNSPKSLTLDYIAGYFSAFPTPILSPLSRFLIRILPHSLTQLPINLPNGNMLVIAKKSNLEL